MDAGEKVVIVGAARTPIGKLGGCLSAVPAPKLGSAAIRGALDRAGLDPGMRRVHHHGQRARSRAGTGPGAAGRDIRRSPRRIVGPHRQQDVRLRHDGRDPRRTDGQVGRRGHGRGGRHGEHEPRSAHPRGEPQRQAPGELGSWSTR